MPAPDYLCGVDAAVDVVGGKWKALILWALESGTHRTGQIRRELPGITDKVLVQQLRELERDGIVHRVVHAEVPPRVEYSLTTTGRELNAALESLGAWGEANRERIAATRRRS
jgi:DNA-binding HxlR family transcriptional regulator